MVNHKKVRFTFDKSIPQEKVNKFLSDVDEEVRKKGLPPYYARKEEEHMEMVKCWALAALLIVLLLIAFGLYLGVHKLAHWLLGVISNGA